MPEMHFVVRWPDESIMSCYSPSLVIADYLEAGRAYSLAEFVERSRRALAAASQRVKDKFGHPCARAEHQVSQIDEKARAFAGYPDARIIVEAFLAPDL